MLKTSPIKPQMQSKPLRLTSNISASGTPRHRWIEYLAIQIREGSLALQNLAGAAGKIASAIEELAAASRKGNDKLSEIADSIADAATELKEGRPGAAR